MCAWRDQANGNQALCDQRWPSMSLELLLTGCWLTIVFMTCSFVSPISDQNIAAMQREVNTSPSQTRLSAFILALHSLVLLVWTVMSSTWDWKIWPPLKGPTLLGEVISWRDTHAEPTTTQLARQKSVPEWWFCQLQHAHYPDDSLTRMICLFDESTHQNHHTH